MGALIFVFSLQFGSEDEREAVELAEAKKNRLISQEKSNKNYPKLPRTAGLRTLSEMTAKLTAAGLDPTRIQERAQMLAKVRAAQGKRKRDESVDVDMADKGDEAPGDGDGDWMDVDGEEGTPQKKKRKSETGAVALKSKKRVPVSNRQLTGFRDAAVSRNTYLIHPWFLMFVPFCFISSLQQAGKAIQLRNLSQRHRNRMAKAGEADRAIRSKMVRFVIVTNMDFGFFFSCTYTFCLAKTSVRRQTKSREDRSEVVRGVFISALSLFLSRHVCICSHSLTRTNHHVKVIRTNQKLA